MSGWENFKFKYPKAEINVEKTGKNLTRKVK